MTKNKLFNLKHVLLVLSIGIMLGIFSFSVTYAILLDARQTSTEVHMANGIVLEVDGLSGTPGSRTLTITGVDSNNFIYPGSVITLASPTVRLKNSGGFVSSNAYFRYKIIMQYYTTDPAVRTKLDSPVATWSFSNPGFVYNNTPEAYVHTYQNTLTENVLTSSQAAISLWSNFKITFAQTNDTTLAGATIVITINFEAMQVANFATEAAAWASYPVSSYIAL